MEEIRQRRRIEEQERYRWVVAEMEQEQQLRNTMRMVQREAALAFRTTANDKKLTEMELITLKSYKLPQPETRPK